MSGWVAGVWLGAGVEAQQQSGSHQNERSTKLMSQTHIQRDRQTNRQTDRQGSTGGTREGKITEDMRHISLESAVAALSSAPT